MPTLLAAAASCGRTSTALAAAVYPTAARATGIAWMLGAGRFGGIAGTLLVGELTRRHFGLEEIFSVLAVPGVVATIALLLKQSSRPEPFGERDAIVDRRRCAEEPANV